MAKLSLRTGEIKEYQEMVIDNVLFLDKRTVNDVMTPRTVVFSLSEHLTLEDAAAKSKKWEHSRFPVYDKNVEDILEEILGREIVDESDQVADKRELARKRRSSIAGKGVK
jgi:CBS domain containing-hemolysin-like protein